MVIILTNQISLFLNRKHYILNTNNIKYILKVLLFFIPIKLEFVILRNSKYSQAYWKS